MELLVKKDNAGNILTGSDKLLLDRARRGDDLTLFIESTDYDEYIIFGNYTISSDRVSAISLAHLDHGDLPDPAALKRVPVATSQYIYDSKTNNVLVKDWLDEGKTTTTVFINNPVYRSYAWYSTRCYREMGSADLDSLKACGDQFKIKLDLADTIKMVVKPSVVYFGHERNRFLVKSASMLLPSELVNDPAAYAAGNKALVDNLQFSQTYLNICSDNTLTIVSKQRCMVKRKSDSSVHQGTVLRSEEGRTLVTCVQCPHTILMPAK